MPRPRWPHLLREVSRHGTVRWVVRIGHGPRIALEETYGTREFEDAYHSAISNAGNDSGKASRTRTSEGTLSWLVARYQASSAWSTLAKATQRQRINFFKGTLTIAAEMPYKDITRKHLIEGREARQHTPSQANNWLDAMRRLFAWAVEQEFLTVNPVEGVKNVKRPKSGGFESWTEDDVDAFERKWGVGSRERLAFAILLYTGLRRGDASRLGRQHVKSGAFTIRAEKTGTQLTIPILPELQCIIDANPKWGSLSYICSENGKPMTKESFGNWFGKACRAAGVNKSAHGLRKLAATRLANAGVSEAELDAIMGWTPGSGMSRVYTRNRDTERLARQAANKLATSYSQPDRKVGNEGEKP